MILTGTFSLLMWIVVCLATKAFRVDHSIKERKSIGVTVGFSIFNGINVDWSDWLTTDENSMNTFFSNLSMILYQVPWGIRWRHRWRSASELSLIADIPLIPSDGMITCVLTLLFLKGSVGCFNFASILRFERLVMVRTIVVNFPCVDCRIFLVEKTDKNRETTKRRCSTYFLSGVFKSTSHV